jgi:hypothetical protein
MVQSSFEPSFLPFPIDSREIRSRRRGDPEANAGFERKFW